MRPTPFLIFGFLFSIACPVYVIGAQEANSKSDCQKHGNQARKFAYNVLDRAKDIAKSKAKGASISPDLDRKVTECQKKLIAYYDACHNPTLENSVNCVDGDQVPSDSKTADDQAKGDGGNGVNKAGEAMVKGLIGKANCSRSLASCFRRGARLNGAPGKDDITKVCETDLGSGSTAADRVWIAAMKESRKDIDEAKEDAAKCFDREGQGAEALAGQIYTNNVLPTRADGAKNFGVGCLDRQDSFRYCAYTENGEPPKIQDLERGDGYDPKYVSELGAPSYIKETGCSGQCVSNGGACSTVLTAGHCTQALNNGATMVVYDKYNVPHTVHASNCDSSFSGSPGNNDYAFCHLDQPVYNTRGVSVAMYDGSVSGSTCTADSSRTWIKRCGTGFYENLATNKQQISATIFPAGGHTSYVTGHVLYDSNSNTIYHDLLTAPGASGASIVVAPTNPNDDPLVVGAHSYSVGYVNRGGASVIKYGYWNAMSVDKVSNMKLSQGTSLMAQFAEGS